MENKVVSLFATKEYQLLFWLSQHQTDTLSGPVIKFSQNELAQEYGASPATVNKWMKELRDAKCVEPCKKRGTYRVTETGHRVITKMDEINAIVGGNRNGE